MGLKSTHQIAEIEIHPENSNIVYAAAVGHLWGYSGERGLFRTEDGGESWEKVLGGLPDDGKTGCTEIIFHPNNPNIILHMLLYRHIFGHNKYTYSIINIITIRTYPANKTIQTLIK